MKYAIFFIILFILIAVMGGLVVINIGLSSALRTIEDSIKHSVEELEECNREYKVRYENIKSLIKSVNTYYDSDSLSISIKDKLELFYNENNDAKDIASFDESELNIKRINKYNELMTLIQISGNFEKITYAWYEYLKYDFSYRLNFYLINDVYESLCEHLCVPYHEDYVYPSIGNILNETKNME